MLWTYTVLLLCYGLMPCYCYAMDLCYMCALSDVFYPFPIRVRSVSEPYPISEIIRIRIRIRALSDPFPYPKNENGYGYGMSTIRTISDPVSPLIMNIYHLEKVSGGRACLEMRKDWS